MQELSNAKLSSAYLNGLKDSLQNSGTGQDGGHAIQDLLRAASLLGGFGFSTAAGLPAGPTSKSTSSKAPAESGSISSKTETDPVAFSDNQQQQTSKTPTPENGQACATALILACFTSVQDSQLAYWAARAFFLHEGDVKILKGKSFTVESIGLFVVFTFFFVDCQQRAMSQDFLLQYLRRTKSGNER